MRGWRTLAFAAALFLIGVVDQVGEANQTAIIRAVVAPDRVGFWLALLAIVIAVLRGATTSPVGERSTGRPIDAETERLLRRLEER